MENQKKLNRTSWLLVEEETTVHLGEGSIELELLALRTLRMIISCVNRHFFGHILWTRSSRWKLLTKFCSWRSTSYRCSSPSISSIEACWGDSDITRCLGFCCFLLVMILILLLSSAAVCWRDFAVISSQFFVVYCLGFHLGHFSPLAIHNVLQTFSFFLSIGKETNGSHVAKQRFGSGEQSINTKLHNIFQRTVSSENAG
mmetsp:Transcript_8216/g.17126  ORF Transcript_8216/g.17126 Transcript_8216/m.17126 type:complete len:201 (-) Transcript_8216:474-1076(-)